MTGYLLALLIGVLLGIVGAGGSILTIPVLVYVVGMSAVTATSYSLFIVGTTALVGAWGYWKKGLLHMKTAFVFVVPSVVTVVLVRKLILPAIPDIIGSWGKLVFTKDEMLLILFSVFMLLASFNMIRAKCVNCDNDELDNISFNYGLIFIVGILVGTITGLLGAGGGFLIVPALVLLVNLPMRFAVGTSLMIIAVNSLIGFAGDLTHLDHVDWPFLLSYAALAVAGIFVGEKIALKVRPDQLKIWFGWFVLAMGIVILIEQFL